MTDREFEILAPQLRRVALAAAQVVPAEADDVAQDTLIKVWTMARDIPGERQARSLAFITARNASINLWKQRREKVPIDSLEPPDGALSPEAELSLTEDLQWLAKRIEQLPRTSRLILDLRQNLRKSNREIAELLGITPDSVAALLSKARRELMNDIWKRTK